MTYSLNVNASYPSGYCSSAATVPGPGSQLTTTPSGSLADLASFFALGDGSGVVFDGAGDFNVRGILCERWLRNFTFTGVGRNGGSSINGAWMKRRATSVARWVLVPLLLADPGFMPYFFPSFFSPTGTAAYYFPISAWQVRGESFHRLLKRIEVWGPQGGLRPTTPFGFNATGRGGARAARATSCTGYYNPNFCTYSYFNSYEFVNFIPDVTNLDVFNPCYALNFGPVGTPRNSTVTGCGCVAAADAAAKAAAAKLGIASASEGAVVTTARDDDTNATTSLSSF